MLKYQVFYMCTQDILLIGFHSPISRCSYDATLRDIYRVLYISQSCGYKTLNNRDVKLYSNSNVFKREKKRIFMDLKNNNYPLHWCRSIFSEVSNPVATPSLLNVKFISIPYYTNILEKISQQLKTANINTVLFRQIHYIVLNTFRKNAESQKRCLQHTLQ